MAATEYRHNPPAGRLAGTWITNRPRKHYYI